ncbi:hypothetical protein PR202_gb24816 [Eleusine coracana subsp. coracana]|uniref:Heparan-alpha-glucosaminide N-acetyltransferase catalytic domain-containing protein n=1 Tax=Eleusine coracana subsp. coracana TaxID=191504 RepID=A0AAV5FJP9_ELECO|nr:hypothetical protein PR202_gb24816 [Eleusine coracana subsp. coracana]
MSHFRFSVITELYFVLLTKADLVSDYSEKTPKMEATVLAIAGDGDDSEHHPLLAPSDEIHAYPESPSLEHPPQEAAAGAQPEQQRKPQRVASLDVFRGLTVAMMILVDDAGGAWPGINHAPWFGVTVADFVMPAFLFIIGVSAALVFKKLPNKMAATKKAAVRAIKLFILGVILQGGYVHGRHSLTYGVDLDHIRWLGVLQRIALGYFLAAISEIWLVNNISVDAPVSFVRKYYMEWLVNMIMAILITVLYAALVFGLYVPNWEFKVQTSNSILSTPRNKVEIKMECSINSPDYGPLPPNAPDWCLAPFDPEGLLSTLMAAVSCFVGLHFGHVLVHCKVYHFRNNMLLCLTFEYWSKWRRRNNEMYILTLLLLQNHSPRMLLWLLSSTVLTVSGFLLQLLGMPFSKPLYTVSYMLLTGGVSGFLLLLLYYIVSSLCFGFHISACIVDISQIKKPFVLFQWMGMNALIVYVLAACELFPALVQGFYWRSPENNLVDMTEYLLQTVFHSKRWGTLVFVLLEIIFWCFAAGFLHRKGIYLKL